MKSMIKLKSFNGVAAGQDATLDVRIGMTIHALLITYAGNLSDYGTVTLKVNGTAVQTFASLVELDQYNRRQGRAEANGIIALDLDRYGLNTQVARELTALSTGAGTGITTVQLEIAVDSGATAPALSAKAIMSAPRPRGPIKHIHRFIPTASHAGDFQWTDLPHGRRVNQLHFLNQNVNNLIVMRDNVELYNRSKAENTMVQTDGKRVPMASVFMFDPTELGDGNEGLDTVYTAGELKGKPVADLRFTLNMGAAGQIPVLAETIGVSPV